MHGRLTVSFRLWSVEVAAHDVLSLGPEIEVLSPPALRDRVATLSQQTATLYSGAT